mgnify:CR=1 FL=1
MSDLPAEIKVWFSRYPIDYMGTWATTRYPAEAVTYVPKADAEAAVALALEEAAENKEQLEIWAHEILAGLAFADVLKIDSYNDKIEAHDMVGRGLVEVIRALAPASGVAKLAALRAERDEWKAVSETLSEMQAGEYKRADTLAAELAAANAREAGLRNFVEDFAAAKIDALRFPRPLSPEDELDPVVEAEEVWAWQADARAALAQPSTEGGE